MSFQAKKWSWRGMAARLLLVPVIAGTSATAVQSQAPNYGGSVGANVANVEKARGLIAESKKALDAGDLATAEIKAKQAAELRVTLSYSETRPDTILAEISKIKQKGAVRTATNTRSTPVKMTDAGSASTRTAVDPKELLRMGQRALSEGKLDLAQDYASQANAAAVAKGYKWGLFEDTPTGLMKDVQDARMKADRAQSNELFRKAKSLLGKRAGSDAERMQNLEQALNMAYQAKNLHGPYSLWEFGDRPDKLISEIESLKTDLRRKSPGLETVARKTGSATPVQPVAGTSRPAEMPLEMAGGRIPSPNLETAPTSKPTTPTAPAAPTAVKAQVAGMVAEGRALLAQDKVLEARVKADVARKLVASSGLNPAQAFAPTEDTPDQLFQAAQVKGNQMIQAWMKTADDQLAANKSAEAKATLEKAEQMSAGLGLYSKSIVERKERLSAIVSGAIASTGSVPTRTLTPPAPTAASTPVAPQQIEIVGSPTTAPGEYLVPAESVAAVVPQAKPAVNPMLAQAESELKRGDFEMAKKIAINVFNSDASAKNDAQALLRTIDAEQTAVKRREAETALKNGMTAFAQKDYDQALGVFKLIDPAYLTPESKTKVADLMSECLVKTEKSQGVTLTAATEDGSKDAMPPKPITSSVVDEQRAMSDIAFQKLRQDGIEAMNLATSAWNRGETDTAMRILDEYGAKVKASNQPVGRQANLLKPIETRLDGYSRLKHNIDVLKKEENEKAEIRRELITKNVAEVQKQDEIKKKLAEVSALNKDKKYVEAEALALQLKQLDPDNPALVAIYEQSKMLRRKEEFAKIRDGQEELFRIGLNDVEDQGPIVTTMSPVSVNPEFVRRNQLRGMDLYQKARTPTELKIEQQLSTPFSLTFEGVSLRDALKKIRSETKLNISTEDSALEDEKISLDSVTVTEDLKDLPLRDALSIILAKGRLSFMVENNVVKVTTERRSKGRLTTKVFHVMDLVTPIPEYGLSPHHTFAGAMASARQLTPGLPGTGMGPTPFVGNNSMSGGTLVSGGAGTPAAPGASGGTLQNVAGGSQQAMTPQRVQYAQQLKKLITGMVRSSSWSDLAGPGSIEYYDIGGALVVNQTADVISEVAQLLESLRRLQDLSVSVEIRVVSLSESFFERVGVDFQMNVKTNNTSFERQIATSQFRPEPFLNDINAKGVTVGWSPATSFTSDLDVPIRATSYGLTSPPFGGYQTSLSPALNGGLSLGLAFLNDIQVYMFLEAAQGNRRVNVMQAPKITLFNGQTSTVFVGDFAFFATGVSAFNVGGQFVYLPQNTAVPIGQGFNPNASGAAQPGVSVTVQAVISADRRFVRLNLTPTLTALTSASVPLFPVTTFVTPVFEGGSQGQPIPFTQFFQQPSITEISAQTTVAVPDGGTVLLGGLKTLAQGRNEFGPPVLSHVPYLNRLFKNVGVGSETRHVMLMVTPRIIISSEEEVRQVGEAGGGLVPQQ